MGQRVEYTITNSVNLIHQQSNVSGELLNTLLLMRDSQKFVPAGYSLMMDQTFF